MALDNQIKTFLAALKSYVRNIIFKVISPIIPSLDEPISYPVSRANTNLANARRGGFT